MLAEAREAAVAAATVEVRRPAPPQRRRTKPARDGYGRPLRQAPAPAPAARRRRRRRRPRTGHPLGIAGKVLLGAALTGVGMGLTSGASAAEPVQDNDTTTSTPDTRSRPSPTCGR